jgi:hypothetical protein
MTSKVDLAISEANDRFQQEPSVVKSLNILYALRRSILRGMVDLNGEDATDLSTTRCVVILMDGKWSDWRERGDQESQPSTIDRGATP